jgi:methylthioribose-1-phosphate isomerase
MHTKCICLNSIRSTKVKVLGKNYRSIWINEDDEEAISIIDQRYLPNLFIIEDLHTVSEMVHTIKDIHVRGAGLIGAAYWHPPIH